MATSPAFDMERILAPLPGQDPAGENSLADPKRQQIQSDITRAENAEKNPIDYSSGKPVAVEPPKWKPIADGLVTLLATKSKDFRLAKELSKASVRLNGVPGLADAIALLKGLTEHYWETAYPKEDPESLAESRLQLIFGLLDQDGSLIRALDRFVFLSDQGGDFTLAQVKAPENIESLSEDQRNELMNSANSMAEQVRSAFLSGKSDRVKNIVEDIDRAKIELDGLVLILQEKCPADSVSFSDLSAKLEELSQFFLKATGQSTGEAGQEQSAAETQSGPERQGGGAAFDFKSQVAGRDQAFAQLRQISDFFRRTEPHSPISYGIDRLLRWGKLTLPQLMQEIVESQDARRSIFNRVGIPEDQVQPDSSS